MKLIYFSDAHGKGKNSKNRLGDYFSDWLLKIDEAIQLTVDNGCEYMIIGGDVFDSPNVSNTVVDEFVDRIENANIQCYIVPGNHDMSSHNWELSKTSALAHIFRRSKNIHELTELETDDVYIKGIAYYHDIEEDIIKEGLKTNVTNKYTIVIPHAFITIKSFHPEVVHIKAEDIDCDYDLVLCSHFHEQWGVEEVNNSLYCNMGAFGRLSITDTRYMPKVALVDTEQRKIDIIELQSAKKSKDIFDVAKYEEIKANKKDIKEFIDSLRSVDLQSMDLGQQITRIGKEQKIKQNVIDHILNTMENVK